MWRHPPLTASRKPVGYLGLDPRVYQSSSSPAKGRRISKQGSPQARWAPVNPAWSVVQDPRLLHAFYERVRVRRGHQIGVVASARKARLLFWSLHRSEDHAHQQPSLTAKKLRLLEIRAGAKTLEGTNTGTWATRQKMRTAERALAEQAEASYKRFLIARGERILRVAPKHMAGARPSAFESWPESELV